MPEVSETGVRPQGPSFKSRGRGVDGAHVHAEDEPSGSVIYGLQPVLEAVELGRPIREIFLSRVDSGTTRELLARASARGVRVVFAPRAELDQRAQTDRHQGVVASLAGALDRYVELKDILEAAARVNEPPLVVLLDEVQDPQNLGAIVRSAYVLGAHGVVLPKNRAEPVTATAIKASAGAAERLPIARVANLKAAISELKAANVWCAAATIEGKPLRECRLDGPLAVVIGSEGRGVRPSVRAACDFEMRIEQARPFNSLNASVAGGILLYEVFRQRQGSGFFGRPA